MASSYKIILAENMTYSFQEAESLHNRLVDERNSIQGMILTLNESIKKYRIYNRELYTGNIYDESFKHIWRPMCDKICNLNDELSIIEWNIEQLRRYGMILQKSQ